MFNIDDKVIFKVLIIRIVLAVATGIGAMAMLSYKSDSQVEKMIGIGIVLIVIGVKILFYKPIILARGQQYKNNDIIV